MINEKVSVEHPTEIMFILAYEKSQGLYLYSYLWRI